MKTPHYAWIALAVTFVVLLTSAAVRATPAVLIVPLEHEFGWSRATISLAVSRARRRLVRGSPTQVFIARRTCRTGTYSSPQWIQMPTGILARLLIPLPPRWCSKVRNRLR